MRRHQGEHKTANRPPTVALSRDTDSVRDPPGGLSQDRGDGCFEGRGPELVQRNARRGGRAIYRGEAAAGSCDDREDGGA